MDATVLAAYIAAGASLVTLVGTTIATSRDNKKTLKQQRDQSETSLTQQRDQWIKTLAEQGTELDKTLKAQSDQLDRTLAEQRTRTLNERFATAAEQLGGDKPPAVQLAGVYAMAVLADDWEKNRQTCVDVLCAYLRMPYEPDPGADASAERQRAFRASREVRHTVIRVITAHLKDGTALSWQGLNFDFTGVVFDGGDFRGVEFVSGLAVFDGAEFSGGKVSFDGARFSGSKVDFTDAKFSGGKVSFGAARFSGGEVSFARAGFSRGEISFGLAEFSGGKVGFHGARFSGGEVYFSAARFSGGKVSFNRAAFSSGKVDFSGEFPGEADLRARFFGGDVDFSNPHNWSFPPVFPWTDTPPPGVKLPKEDQSQA